MRDEPHHLLTFTSYPASHNILTGCERTLHTTLIDGLFSSILSPSFSGHTQLHRDQNALAIFAIADTLTGAPQKATQFVPDRPFPSNLRAKPHRSPSQWTVLDNIDEIRNTLANETLSRRCGDRRTAAHHHRTCAILRAYSGTHAQIGTALIRGATPQTPCTRPIRS